MLKKQNETQKVSTFYCSSSGLKKEEEKKQTEYGTKI